MYEEKKNTLMYVFHGLNAIQPCNKSVLNLSFKFESHVVLFLLFNPYTTKAFIPLSELNGSLVITSSFSVLWQERMM